MKAKVENDGKTASLDLDAAELSRERTVGPVLKSVSRIRICGIPYSFIRLERLYRNQ